MIYLRYRSAFAPELPYKSIPQCKFYSTLHLTMVLSWFTRDYYANFWKNPHLSCAVMESPHVNTSAQRTTLEQKKPRPVLSTYHPSYFFPTFFLFQQTPARPPLNLMCFKMPTAKQTTHRAISPLRSLGTHWIFLKSQRKTRDPLSHAAKAKWTYFWLLNWTLGAHPGSPSAASLCAITSRLSLGRNHRSTVAGRRRLFLRTPFCVRIPPFS